ncbi:MAG: DEAD/DEAH box helicase [Treponema sp.]|jgi:ATP-dependent RNA helicase DeaD|nr:DEAD/DEAH box helicase [Treponema sp.]
MLVDENQPFSSFGLSDAVLNALTRKGFELPTPIQTIALPRLLAESGHLVVKARTGTGKTAAFGIPLVERITLWRTGPQALILTPTRELALQVSREIASFVPAGRQEGERSFPRITAVYGGASIRNQILDLKRGTEIVVGTPGRVMDLMDRKVLDLSGVDWFILDEADEMLDMGFFEDVETIMASLKGGPRVPAENESEGAALPYRVALFSATMPDEILRVIRKHIGEVEILEDGAGEEKQSLLIDQFYMVLKREDRLEALRRVIDGAENFYGLIFCGTKAETDELARRLVENGYPAEAIHGDLSQEARERTLRRFRSKQTTIMVATDVAARGLDIERLTHVVNWDLPHDREAYVHRIGRTGRAGRKGKAVTLALPSDRGRIGQLSRNMERVLGSGILWMKVPSVKSVMKAVRARIVADVLAGLPEMPEEMPAELPLELPLEVPQEAFSPDAALTIPAAPGEPFPAESSAGESAPGAAESAAAFSRDLPSAASPEPPPGGGGGPLSGVSLSDASVEAAGEAPSPFLAKVCRQLIDRLGPEKAVEALIRVHYGELLDPSRYGTVAEFAEAPPPRPLRGGRVPWEGPESGRGRRGAGGRRENRGPGVFRDSFGGRREGRNFTEDNLSDAARVYVGLGRQHGASARDVAALLMRAGGVPGRLVDAIEIKDYCAFATMPEDAARRACVFSRNTPAAPPIRFARPVR